LLAVALLAGGAGVGWVLADQSPAPELSISGGTTLTTSAPAVEIVPGDEPVADVAAALLPSMVQIDTSFGLGSGFVYEPGRIMTAAHVVEGQNQVQVRYADGQIEDGTVLGTNPENDVAVIEVGRTDVPAAPLALDEELRVGQLAIAIGSPWGLDQTVTSGIISAVARPVPSRNGVQILHQTDASINPGNSGGALVDREGKVIGINVQIFSTSGSNAGIGFAVPIDRAFRLASQIVSGTTIETAYLGVRGEDATGDRAGALVTTIETGGPAAAAGLREGDVVVAVDTLPVLSITDLVGRIRNYMPGDTVVLDVLRDGKTITLSATLDARQDG
jgi:S1-C subfamily serine protease